MDLQDEEPPSLVNMNETNTVAPDPTATQLQNLSLAKVPLTIVTGMRFVHLRY